MLNELIAWWLFGIPVALIALIYFDKDDYEVPEMYDPSPDSRTALWVAGIFWPITLLLLIIFFVVVSLMPLNDVKNLNRRLNK